MPPECSDSAIGATLRATLKLSKRTGNDEFQAMFASNVVREVGHERITGELSSYGFPNAAELYENMMCCWVKEIASQIEVKPTLHKAFEDYSGISKEGPEVLYLSNRVSDEELGAALREGFRRCTRAQGVMKVKSSVLGD